MVSINNRLRFKKKVEHLSDCFKPNKVNDYVEFKTLIDVISRLTACSVEDSYNGNFKDIQYEIH